MALRDQPYFPLYVQDFLTDEKLNLCSAATQGVYIKLLCIFHKSDPYGGYLFKQRDKLTDKQNYNFACKFAKLLPFDAQTIEAALDELIEEGVLTLEGDFLFQKRMVKDFEISLARSQAGKKGGGNPNLIKQTNKQEFKQNDKQNTEYEYEYENVNENVDVIVIDNKVKNKEKEVENFSPEFKNYLDWAKRNFPDLLKFKKPLTDQQLHDLFDEFKSRTLVREKLEAIGNTNKSHINYTTVYATCRNWCKRELKAGWKEPEETGTGNDVYTKTYNELVRRDKSRQPLLNQQNETN